MMREMTGMLVTAMARLNTSNSAGRLWAAPSRGAESTNLKSTAPATNGHTKPVTVTKPTTRLSPRRNTVRISAPEQNISRNSPSWYVQPRTTAVGPSGGKIRAWTSGASAPRTVGPSSNPPTISPITRGWRTRVKR